MGPPSTELLTLVSQKMCVVVYPEMDGGSETKGTQEDIEEQQQPIYQPHASKDLPEQPQP